MSFMEDGLGLNITRVNKTSISVRFPGDKQAIKLKGAMFEPQTNLEKFGSKNSKLRTTEEHKQAVQDLRELLAIRANYLLGGRTEHIAKTTTRKGNVYERKQRKQNNSGGPEHHLSSGTTSRCQSFLLIGKSSLERNLLPRCEGLLSHSTGRTIEGFNRRSQTIEGTAPSPITQNKVHHHNVGGAGRTGRWLRPSTTSPAFNIEQKIWSLSLELNDCPVGSAEAMAIIHQLNALQREKEEGKHLPSPRPFKPRFK